MDLYRIVQGVHRCVAAHQAGRTEIRARIDRGGILGPIELVPLSNVYSPKPAIGRWDRGRDFLVLVHLMANPMYRDTMEPVILNPVSPKIAGYLTRVADVVVNPV
jgi:hypothetical protein